MHSVSRQAAYDHSNSPIYSKRSAFLGLSFPAVCILTSCLHSGSMNYVVDFTDVRLKKNKKTTSTLLISDHPRRYHAIIVWNSFRFDHSFGAFAPMNDLSSSPRSSSSSSDSPISAEEKCSSDLGQDYDDTNNCSSACTNGEEIKSPKRGKWVPLGYEPMHVDRNTATGDPDDSTGQIWSEWSR